MDVADIGMIDPGSSFGFAKKTSLSFFVVEQMGG